LTVNDIFWPHPVTTNHWTGTSSLLLPEHRRGARERLDCSTFKIFLLNVLNIHRKVRVVLKAVTP